MKTGITAARAIGVTCKQIVATLSATVTVAVVATVAVAIVTGGAAFQYLTHKTSLIDQI